MNQIPGSNPNQPVEATVAIQRQLPSVNLTEVLLYDCAEYAVDNNKIF